MVKKKGSDKTHFERNEQEVDTEAPESYNDIDIEEEGETQNDTIKKLRKRLKECEAQKEEYLAGMQRLRADFVNARHEDEKRRTEFKREAHVDFIESLLPVLDSFHMAFANKEAWEQVDETWRKGVEHIHAQLMQTLEGYGLMVIDPQGETFDPAYHSSLEAVDTTDETLDNTIAAVIQSGYMVGEKVVRPAKVNVYVTRKDTDTHTE